MVYRISSKNFDVGAFSSQPRTTIGTALKKLTFSELLGKGSRVFQFLREELRFFGITSSHVVVPGFGTPCLDPNGHSRQDWSGWSE